jgi:cellulose synthase/poly-beta-1,6-N-acetylglucosamine synthase-like glycosyltransferase
MDIQASLPFVSIIIPVKNAERFLASCLRSLNQLSYPKDKYEIIISDSDSTDKTREIAVSLGAQVVIAAGPSVCAGRNSGFTQAKGEIIAFSDADCIMDKDWLMNAVKYFQDEKVACVGGVSFVPDDETAFGKACGFIFSYSLFTGGSTYGRHFPEVREVEHNPGCNAIYRRSALEKVMPVDERFTDGEDVIMNKQLKDLGYKFLFTPDTKLWHYRSSTPKRFWKQKVRYGIGRVLIGRAYPGLLKPMHVIVGFSIPLLILTFIASVFLGVAFLAGFLLLGMGFLLFFFLSAWLKTRSLEVASAVPPAIIILMLGWSTGFMQETFWPQRRT